MDEAEFHRRLVSHISTPNDDPDLTSKVDRFKAISSYVAGDYEDDKAYQELTKKIEEIESKYENKERNRLFYMALPPSVFLPVAKGLKKNCYTTEGVIRVIVEKPFGKDTESCRELIKGLKEQFTEEETYRIDHYLGKEMVKNMLVSRFANMALAAGFDKNSVSNVQITFKEPFGTEGRGGYFDEFGMIRDVCQNREYLCLVSHSNVSTDQTLQTLHKCSVFLPWNGQFLFQRRIFVTRRYQIPNCAIL